MTATVHELRSGVTAADVIGGYLAAQRDEVVANAPRVRRREPDSVHDLRVATRRLRSALATYRPLLDRRSSELLRPDLKWLAGALAGARDTEVVHARIIEMLAQEPRDPTLGTVRHRIDADLFQASDAAHVQALEAMDSARYDDLLARLDAFVDDTPWSEDAYRPAKGVLAPRVRSEWTRLRRSVTAAERYDTQVERDELLHAVRKAAKRARYAAEAAEPVFGAPAKDFARAAARLQTVLGERQDTVVTLHGIRSLAAKAQRHGESAFVYGRLHAREQARAAEAEKDFAAAWERLAGKGMRRWLKT